MYEGHPESKERLRIQSAHVLLQPIVASGVQRGVEKLPRAVIHRTLSRGKCRDSCGHGCADCEVRGVIRFLQADKILGYLIEEASSRVELFCCTTMYVRILPDRHKPCLWIRGSRVRSQPGSMDFYRG